jgi:hypothetical protein
MARRGEVRQGWARQGIAGRGWAGIFTEGAWAMRIHLNIKGTTPMMQHNEQLSDPDNEFTKAIKELTAKGVNQTDADRAQIRRLEWQGGLYLFEGKIVVPVANVIRSFREAATMTKKGKDVAGAIVPIGSMYIPLIYDGPTDLNKLYLDNRFVDSRQVKVGRGRIKRTRPIFQKWALGFDLELMEDAMNFSTFEGIVDRAGLIKGLCDARIIGFGRFEGKIAKVLAKAA